MALASENLSVAVFNSDNLNFLKAPVETCVELKYTSKYVNGISNMKEQNGKYQHHYFFVCLCVLGGGYL